jgi:hypothetical protein
MEGGVMISRSFGSVEPFDRAVKQLRQHFQLLLPPQEPAPATTKNTKAKRQPTGRRTRQ